MACAPSNGKAALCLARLASSAIGEIWRYVGRSSKEARMNNVVRNYT
jgi:hypothetical protein